jgi:hypothetical protein
VQSAGVDAAHRGATSRRAPVAQPRQTSRPRSSLPWPSVPPEGRSSGSIRSCRARSRRRPTAARAARRRGRWAPSGCRRAAARPSSHT